MRNPNRRYLLARLAMKMVMCCTMSILFEKNEPQFGYKSFFDFILQVSFQLTAFDSSALACYQIHTETNISNTRTRQTYQAQPDVFIKEYFFYDYSVQRFITSGLQRQGVHFDVIVKLQPCPCLYASCSYSLQLQTLYLGREDRRHDRPARVECGRRSPYWYSSRCQSVKYSSPECGNWKPGAVFQTSNLNGSVSYRYSVLHRPRLQPPKP